MTDQDTGKTWVFHFRLHEWGNDGLADGEFVEPTLLPRGGATVAFYDEDNGDVTGEVALCSAKDQFVRKIGSSITRGRLAKGFSKLYHSSGFIDDEGKPMRTALIVLQEYLKDGRYGVDVWADGVSELCRKMGKDIVLSRPCDVLHDGLIAEWKPTALMVFDR